MIPAIGTGFFGKVDCVPGRCHVVTRFGFCAGIPLIPLDSWAVPEVKPGSAFAIANTAVTQSMFGVQFHTLNDGSQHCVRVPFSWKSFLLTYVRSILYVLHLPSLATVLIFGFLMAIMAANGKLTHPDPVFAVVLQVLTATAIFSGIFLYLSYRWTIATPARARELCELLGIVYHDWHQEYSTPHVDTVTKRGRSTNVLDITKPGHADLSNEFF